MTRLAYGGDNVSQYAIGPGGGLAPMATATVPSGPAPYAITTTGTIR
jgi:hypothetical protein